MALNLKRSHRYIVKERLQELGVRPSRRLGQSFLVDPDACRRVVACAQLSGREVVLEIGPGLGALTEYLAEVASRVICVEIDYRLAEELTQVFLPQNNVEIHQADALTVNYGDLLPRDQRVTLVSSLPYSVVGMLLATMLRSVPQVDRLVIVVQKEVAEKIVATPGDKAYGILALITKFHATAQQVGKISGRSFYPVPEVESSIVHLKRTCPPRVHCGEEFVWKVVDAAFSMRRKMIVNSISCTMNIDRHLLGDYLSMAGVSPQVRAETLGLTDFLKIAEVLYNEVYQPQ